MADFDYDSLRKHREKRFAAGVKPCDRPLMDNEMALSVTKNGKQWETITLSPKEAESIVSLLQNHLSSLNK